jgi:hypothetical protein
MLQDSLLYNNTYFFGDSIYTYQGEKAYKYINKKDSVDPHKIGVKQLDTIYSSNKLSLFKCHQLKSVNKNPICINQIRNNNEDFILGILIFCFVLFAWIQVSFKKRFFQICKAFLSKDFVNQLVREGNLFKEYVSIFLFINFFASISLLIYITNLFLLNIQYYSKGLLLYIEIFSFVLIFFLLKIFVIKFTGILFKAKKESEEHILHMFLFNYIIGVTLLFLLVFIIYANKIGIIVLYVSLVLTGLIYLYRLIRIGLIWSNNKKISMFYLFLYLCGLEILPLILLTKLIVLF